MEKIDSYCLGRVLFYLKFIYDNNKAYCCYNNEINTGKLIDEIINTLIEDDVYKRLYILDCRKKFFKE